MTTDDVTKWLKGFCKGDLFDMDFRRRIIDVLINAIYLYDDRVVIYYNVKGGQQVSYMEMLDETKDIFAEMGLSGSDCAQSGQPVY